MKRFLISQMLHEFRSNIWLIIELMIVSGVVCYLCYNIISVVQNLFAPAGIEYDNVYTLQMKIFSDDKDSEANGSNNQNSIQTSAWRDRQDMMAKLRSNPHVEAVAIADNAIPFVLNYQGNELLIEGQPDSIIYAANVRTASPDIVRVLKLKTLTGLSTPEMENRLRRGEILISPEQMFHLDDILDGGVRGLVGKNMFFKYDSLTYYKVGDYVRQIPRCSYEVHPGGMALFPIDEDKYRVSKYPHSLLVRVKDGESQQFISDYNSDPALRSIRSAVLYDLQPLEITRNLTDRDLDIQTRMYAAMLGFFLIIIFLGLLGTFWLRVQQRSSEIALRKVTGAKNSDIFRRLISEGSILLISGFLIGAAAFIVIFKKYIVEEVWVDLTPWSTWWVARGVSYAVMQLIVILGIWIPARRAISIKPAIALRDE